MKKPFLLSIYIVAFLISACAPAPQLKNPAPSPSPTIQEWLDISNKADSLAGLRLYAALDSTLADFQSKYAPLTSAEEINLWRAIYKLDPKNQNSLTTSNISSAKTMLEKYISSGQDPRNVQYATILISLIQRPAKPASSAATEASLQHPQITAQENAILKDQVARLTDELDRIKRRLSSPTP